MAFCTECGASIPDGVKFCTSCGALAKSEPQKEPAATGKAATPPQTAASQTSAIPDNPPSQATPMYIQQPVYAPQQPAEVQPPTGKYAVMSTGAYVLTSILFAIPIIGPIACIIMAFASQNLNRKNFARALLIFMIIGLIFSLILFIIGYWMKDSVTYYMNEIGISLSGDGFGELIGQLSSISDKN